MLTEEEVLGKDTGNIFNKIIAVKFPNLEKKMPIQEVFRTPNKQDQKRTSLYHTIVKTLSIENKERILKAARE
jgi:hypothetical protein